MKQKLVSVLVLVLAFAMIACTTSQIITTVTMVTQVLETELPVILPLLAGLSSTQRAEITAYLGAYQACASSAVAELATEDVPAVKADNIAAACGRAVLPNLSGTPATVATGILALNAVLQAFLMSQQPSGNMATRTAGSRLVFPQHLSWNDRRKLGGLQKRLDAAKIQIAGGK